MSRPLTDEELTGIDMSAACGDFGEPAQFHAMTDEIREGRTRIAALEHELAKADRRTAEQEGIMAKQREKIEALRDGLGEAIAGWSDSLGGCPDDDIARLRKLTETP